MLWAVRQVRLSRPTTAMVFAFRRASTASSTGSLLCAHRGGRRGRGEPLAGAGIDLDELPAFRETELGAGEGGDGVAHGERAVHAVVLGAGGDRHLRERQPLAADLDEDEGELAQRIALLVPAVRVVALDGDLEVVD